MENKLAVLIGGIVISLMVCYYLNRELSSARVRISDIERAVTMHHKAFEDLNTPEEEVQDTQEVAVENDVKTE
tara:strand:- start:383 stop:601 length:219 start_codon:yes stop_codon:yes gene_type:complete